MWYAGSIAFLLSFQLCLAAGRSTTTFAVRSKETLVDTNGDGGRKLVCYFTPTSYFSASQVPPRLCTHLLYAFGSINSDGSDITAPTANVKANWVILVNLRRQNPQLKVMLSLQKGFPDVVGSDQGKMQRFATNSVSFLRNYGFDGVDMDWEYPSSSEKTAFAQFLRIMRAAVNKDAQAGGKPALLLSIALPNNQYVVERSFDVKTISSTVDFGMVMAYDFHLYTKGDTTTGFNSPLYTPKEESKYLSASAMGTYFLSHGFPGPKLLLGIPTFGRSWTLASSSSHGLHSKAVGKGAPGPYRHFTGIYTYPDACVALRQGAVSVRDTQLEAVYLYKNTTWVAYDDGITVTAKVKWAQNNSLGGVGVWAMHLDDVAGECGGEPFPLIRAMDRALLLGQAQTLPRSHLPLHPTTDHQPPLTAPQEEPGRGMQFPSDQKKENHVRFPNQNLIRFPDGGGKEDNSLLFLGPKRAHLHGISENSSPLGDDLLHYGWMLQSQRVSRSRLLQQSRGLSGSASLQRLRSRSHHDDAAAVIFMENADAKSEKNRQQP